MLYGESIVNLLVGPGLRPGPCLCGERPPCVPRSCHCVILSPALAGKPALRGAQGRIPPRLDHLQETLSFFGPAVAGPKNPMAPRAPLSVNFLPSGRGWREGSTRRPAHALVSMERALRACCHREDPERSEGDDAIPCDSAGLLRPLPGARNDRHGRKVFPTLFRGRGGACPRPPPHGPLADTEHQLRV